jgi:hypothetical protein
MGGLGASNTREEFLRAPGFVAEPTLGVRGRRRVGDFDLGLSLVVGLDETPRLRLRPEVARYLAREVLIAADESNDALEGYPCEPAQSAASCLGGHGALSHGRTASLAADAAWGLGVVILKAEFLAQPRLSVLPGKTAWLVDGQNGVTSSQLSLYGGALAVEGAIGDWLDGSIEVFELMWSEVPGETRLYGVERADSDVANDRAVHRFGVAASLRGAFLEDRLRWRLRGEGGVLQQDVRVSGQLRYRLPVLNLYVGGHGDIYAGAAGSPGWMQQDASMIGVFVGEGA